MNVFKTAPNIVCTGQVQALPTLGGIRPRKPNATFGIFPPNPALAGKTCRWRSVKQHSQLSFSQVTGAQGGKIRTLHFLFTSRYFLIHPTLSPTPPAMALQKCALVFRRAG
jgi:hypothetical protein